MQMTCAWISSNDLKLIPFVRRLVRGPPFFKRIDVAAATRETQVPEVGGAPIAKIFVDFESQG